MKIEICKVLSRTYEWNLLVSKIWLTINSEKMKFQQFCLRLRPIEIEICTLLKKDKTSKAKLSSISSNAIFSVKKVWSVLSWIKKAKVMKSDLELKNMEEANISR